MWSSHFTQNLPSRGDLDNRNSPSKEPSTIDINFNSSAPPNLNSETQAHEPTPPAITSDILPPETPVPHVENPRTGSNGHPTADGFSQPAFKQPLSSAASPQSASPAPTPRTSRLEVVLNISSFKNFSGHQMFDEVNSEDDELMTSHVTPNKRPRTSRVQSTSRYAEPVAKSPVPAAIKRLRGRPKGWKPGVPSTKTGLPTASAAKYLDANGSLIKMQKSTTDPKTTGTGQKRRGRPPRPPSPTARSIWETMKPPKYLPFQCEWEKCRAELQNIETLRKHVRLVHANSESLVCRWAKCLPTVPPVSFTDALEFQRHMDTAHLMPYVWHCGEGQNNSRCMTMKKKTDLSQDEIPEYLFGPNGKQVTPSVRDQLIEDALTYRDNRRRLRRILFQRDANAPSEDEDEEAGALASP